MKKILILFFILLTAIRVQAQRTFNDSLSGFDNVHFQEHLSQIRDKSVRENYIKSVQQNFIKNKYHLIQEKMIVSPAISSSTCGNFDFEDGTANGWAITGDYQIMSGSATDPFGNFPVVCPGGNFSLRLNDNNVNAVTCSPPGTKSSYSATATNTIAITTNNYFIKVNFAGATLNFPHSLYDAARIKIEFFDQFSNLISPNYMSGYFNPPGGIISTAPTTYSNATSQGLQVCSYGYYPVTYYPWQTKIFNLAPYIGQSVKIKLSANWCLYQYDWAYAYFDVCCNLSCPTLLGSNSITQKHDTCMASSFSTTICNSNPNETNFQWSNSTGPLSTSSCITANSFGSYTLTSNPISYPTFTVNEIYNFGTFPVLTFTMPSTICNTSAPISLSASPPGGSFSGPGVTGYTYTPTTVGLDSITYIYSEPIAGCKSSITQTFQVVHCKITDIKKNGNDQKLIIAPNPFNSQLEIKLDDYKQNSEFILFNALGQEILRKQITEGKNSIETESLPPGLYIYSLFSQNKQVKQGKLVKE